MREGISLSPHNSRVKLVVCYLPTALWQLFLKGQRVRPCAFCESWVFLLGIILVVAFYKCKCPSHALFLFSLLITLGLSPVRNSLNWKKLTWSFGFPGHHHNLDLW